MNEISNSIVEAIKKRTASATLGTYFFFWCAYHWQGLYVTFFVNQDLIFKTQNGLLKNEYVDQYFFGWSGWNDFDFYLGIVIPGMLTYLFIWWLPHILLKMYRKEQWFKIEKRIIRIEQEKKIQEDRKELAKETTEAIQEEVKTARAKKSAAKIDPKLLWDEEIVSLKKSKQYEKLRDVFICYYRYGGERRVEGTYKSMPEFELNADSLRIADTYSLVTMSSNGKVIALNEKGKYFASKYEGRI